MVHIYIYYKHIYPHYTPMIFPWYPTSMQELLALGLSNVIGSLCLGLASLGGAEALGILDIGHHRERHGFFEDF